MINYHHLQEHDELREPLHRFHHQPEEREPVVGADLLDLEEVSEGGLPLGLHFGQLHRHREVVYEVRIDVQHHRLRERVKEDLACG